MAMGLAHGRPCDGLWSRRAALRCLSHAGSRTRARPTMKKAQASKMMCDIVFAGARGQGRQVQGCRWADGRGLRRAQGKPRQGTCTAHAVPKKRDPTTSALRLARGCEEARRDVDGKGAVAREALGRTSLACKHPGRVLVGLAGVEQDGLPSRARGLHLSRVQVGQNLGNRRLAARRGGGAARVGE
jgi:hypothetical protein